MGDTVTDIQMQAKLASWPTPLAADSRGRAGAAAHKNSELPNAVCLADWEGQIAGPARLTADPDRLGEALINLLDNAFKYTPSGGSVDLTVTGESGWLRVEVADSGPGIPPEEAPWIFERYYRGGGVSAEGAGLGLAIARGIVERHGGSIWTESEESPGARFVFKVPEGVTVIDGTKK